RRGEDPPRRRHIPRRRSLFHEEHEKPSRRDGVGRWLPVRLQRGDAHLPRLEERPGEVGRPQAGERLDYLCRRHAVLPQRRRADLPGRSEPGEVCGARPVRSTGPEPRERVVASGGGERETVYSGSGSVAGLRRKREEVTRGRLRVRRKFTWEVASSFYFDF